MHRARFREARAESAELALELALRRLRVARGLDDEHRLLRSSWADPHECGSCDARVVVEDRLHRIGTDGHRRRHDTLVLAAAEPETPRLVEVSHVSHAMPNAMLR